MNKIYHISPEGSIVYSHSYFLLLKCYWPNFKRLWFKMRSSICHKIYFISQNQLQPGFCAWQFTKITENSFKFKKAGKEKNYRQYENKHK